MELRLSQDLTINNRYTISVPGETEKYFSTCNENGCCEWLPSHGQLWFALTEQAKEMFIGKTKVDENGITLGYLFEYHESDEFILGL